MAVISSCLDCKERRIGCHQTCEKYKKFKKQLDVIKQNKLKEKEKYTRPIHRGKR